MHAGLMTVLIIQTSLGLLILQQVKILPPPPVFSNHADVAYLASITQAMRPHLEHQV